MKTKKASDVKVGDTVHIQYGDYNNWITTTITQITTINIGGKEYLRFLDRYIVDFVAKPDELITVVSD